MAYLACNDLENGTRKQNMKKLIATFILVLMVSFIIGCGTTTDQPQTIEEEIQLTTENFKLFFDVIMDVGEITVSSSGGVTIAGIYIPKTYSGETNVTMTISPARNFDIINVKNVNIRVNPAASSTAWENDYCKYAPDNNVSDTSPRLSIDIPSSGNRTISIKYATKESFLSESSYDLKRFTPSYILRDVSGSVVVRKQVNKGTSKSTTRFNSVSIGDIVSFGRFEQDGLSTDGDEDISWIVIGKDNGKTLLLSEKILSVKPFDDNSGEWATSELRKWLNNDFYSSVFSSTESKKICLTSLNNQTITDIGIFGNGSTEDKVFLLSYDEVNQYLNESTRTADITTYALMVSSSSRNNGWWLRSIGANSDNCAGVVYSDGSWSMPEKQFFLDSTYVSSSSYSVSVDFVGVRPAIWVDD